MKKVTVVVPFYNVDAYIGECLDSLIKQTYENIEIMCIDDCSPDGSLEIVESYADKDSRIRILKHGTNKGLGGARNTGIKHATGDYIWFVDSDDYVVDTFVEKLYRAIVNDDSDMVIYGFWIFENGEKKQCLKAHDNAVIDVSANNTLEIAKSYRSATWLKLYKRELIASNEIYQPENQY